jgi:two-component system phosphate regulon sensor histidine kinase PhoR
MLNAQRHAIIYFYDVTAVERLESTRQEFLSNISHELRTPLTSILAFVETLEDGAVDDPDNNRRFLEVIRRNAERMRALINDVLELSQIESGRISIDIGEVKLHRAVADVFTDLSAAASARDIDLISNIPADAVVTADADRLYQMLTNLVDNAVKFNRDGGTVTVSLERRPGRDVIAVADTGEGITSELIDRIFERFYRADRARSRDVGGTGLGLSIVKHLARLQGGEVTATSVAGSGTTFIIELPAK